MPVTAAGTLEATRRPPLAFIYSVTVTGILANALIAAPLPDILDYFDQPDAAGGLVIAAATLPGIVMAPVIGGLAGGYGRRPGLVPGLVIGGFAGLAAGLAPTFELLVIARLAQGVGSAGLINLAVVLIGDHWHGNERARLIGYNAAVLTVSIAILPTVSGVLDQIGGWRWSFAPYVLALGTATAALRFVDKGRPHAPPPLLRQIRSSVGLLREPLLSGSIAFGFVLFALIFGLFLTVMPLVFERDFGLEPGVRGLALSTPALTATAAALLLGRTRRRLGPRRLMLVGIVVLAAGFGAIGLATVLVFVLIGALLYGFGEGSALPTAQDLVAGAAPPEARGAMVALWVGSARAGQTAGPLLGATLLDSHGYRPLFLGAAAACAMMATLVWRTPPRWYPTS